MAEEEVLLYHETQESKLCAVHCLNAVLQGPYFSELELAAIARELDQTERDMMLENGSESAEYLRFVSEGSSNVALDGNFSIQVLQKALAALDLKCIPLISPELQADQQEPHKHNAFICNLEEHWFALRRIGSQWYNFNSLLAAPQQLSSFYMSAFLDSLKNEGWSIFVVQGELPRAYNSVDNGGSFGRWFTPQQAEETLVLASLDVDRGSGNHHHQQQQQQQQQQRSSGSSSDPMLEAAIKASLKDVNPETRAEDPGVIDRETLAAAIAASLESTKPM